MMVLGRTSSLQPGRETSSTFMKHAITSALLLFAILWTDTPLRAQHLHSPSESQLKKMVLEDDNFTAITAIDIATRRLDGWALVAAVDNQSWEVRTEAVKAMAMLPEPKARFALLAVLTNDKLWAARAKAGGEEEANENAFQAVVQAAVSKTFGVDVTSSDLWVLAQRADAIVKAKQQMK